MKANFDKQIASAIAELQDLADDNTHFLVDRAGYREIASLLQEGNYKAAWTSTWLMDTAPREEISADTYRLIRKLASNA